MTSIDRRSLVAFRIGLALVVLLDLADRARDLVAHYTDAGVLPVRALPHIAGAAPFCLHARSGSPVFVAFLFALAAVAAALLLVGVWTRAATFVSWLLLVSLQARNPLVLHFGDALLRLLLFWSIFLPLERGGGEPRRSIAVAALKLQVLFLYWFSAAQKTGVDWTSGTAVYYALSYGFLTRPLGEWLLGVPWLIAPLTYGTIAVEALGPFLLLAPERRWRVRIAGVALFIALHAAFLLTMDLGIFSLAGMVAALPFLPARAWGPTNAAAADAPRPVDRVLEQLLPAPFVALVAYVNVVGLFWPQLPHIDALDRLAAAVHVEQRWRMFAPDVSREDGWFVVAGTRADGTEIPVSLVRPDDVRSTLPSQRWRLYFVSLTMERSLPALPAYAAYVCRTEGLKRVALHFMLTKTPPPSTTSPRSLQDRIIWDMPCSAVTR